ncbi:uncharacterized protein LACBIDRAFT_309997 [Laccaria bicolor S238N-H82]|uniref:Predicted protein n=1 Tax=Laccaria bicolor (strain S238N-H82 / ATCC MYA-4686) TaxID=486041 RepID=B0DTF4_LACBS|nr:uncharacterized protein LACBIDRAFT_309997 [Laccaria bicolor S238N-H82]EDR02054.1 predicted protein [Laccaria bicolor S238N-H82]|eukprot:XP_001887211.1 predicted protein [Laccaria bicolor S238N-H82]
MQRSLGRCETQLRLVVSYHIVNSQASQTTHDLFEYSPRRWLRQQRLSPWRAQRRRRDINLRLAPTSQSEDVFTRAESKYMKYNNILPENL